MRFVLISDLHVDINPWDWSLLQHCDPTVPMVVAGDISNDVFEASRWIADLRLRFNLVIWVPGNHDFYNLRFHKTSLFSAKWPYPRTVAEIYDHYLRWSEAHDIIFLNRSSSVIHGMEFVGATGWHNFDAGPQLRQQDQIAAWQEQMNDSRYITWDTNHMGDWKPVLEAARQDAAYIKTAVAANSLPKVVITHHIPHSLLAEPHVNSVWRLLNGSYVNSELENCSHPSVTAWCFGHTHSRVDRDLNGTRYINNARGYPYQNPGWFAAEIEI